MLIGAMVSLAGTVLLISGATPALDARLAEVRRIVPLPLLELSHLAGSVTGVGLLILARGLYRRLNAAYHMTFWLLIAGIFASLVKGFDVEEATFLALVLLVLRLASGEFYRPSSLFEQRLSPGWFLSVAIIFALSVWIGFLTYRHVPYSRDLWWTFALHGDASRMLRASLAGSVLFAAFLLAYWLRIPREPSHSAPAEDLARAHTALSLCSSSVANAVLTGDKRILFHPSGDAFVMYQVSGRSWIALGDPVGPIARHAELVWAFRELVDRWGGQVAFYQVGAQSLPLYVDLGLSLTKLGEEARVDLKAFTLQGSRAADLRQTHRRAQRAAASFEIIPPENVAPLLPRLRRVSDAWLADKAAREKGFSVGSFDENYLVRLPLAVVRAESEIVAFANLWPTATREELSVDLMRFSAEAPPSTMDYLFTELMLWGQAQGYRWFNLGMAPLSGLENRALAPLWHRVGSFLYRHGESFYNFEGLRRFKEKFNPRWEPRYLASAGGMRLPRALLDISTLISGGFKELVTK
jgi:phosphatidylglycerol lysyltransferase